MSAPQTYRQHARALTVLGWPLVGSNMAYVAIGFADTIMLGWYSVEALAAQVVAQSFFFVLFLVGSGFAWAVMPLVASHAEAGEITELRRVTRMGLWASIAFGIVALPVLLAGEFILGNMGQKEELLPLIGDYLTIIGWSIFPALVVMTLRSYLSALERTQVLFWITVGAAALNAFLNWVLIFGRFGAPELGISGAAIASLVMQVATLVFLAIYIRIVEPGHQLFRRLWRVDWAALHKVFKYGWPIGLTTFAEVSLFAASAVMMGWLGTVPLAAHGIAIQIASLTFVVHLGLSNAATVRVGRAVGRGDFLGLRRGGVTAIALSIAMATITIAVFLSIPETLVSAFIRPDETQRDAIIGAAATLLLIAAAFQLFDGLQVIGLGLLRGLPDTTVPMIIATIAYWLVGMPMSYVLGFSLGYGGPGVWFGLVIGLAVAAALLISRFWRKSKA